MRNCWRGTANGECCPTCRTGHLLLSVVSEVLVLFSSSCRMFTSSAVTQIKTDPLLVKGEFSGALPNIVYAIRWLFERLEGNNSRMVFYNMWSVQVPVILLFVHSGSAGKSKTVQSSAGGYKCQNMPFNHTKNQGSNWNHSNVKCQHDQVGLGWCTAPKAMWKYETWENEPLGTRRKRLCCCQNLLFCLKNGMKVKH